MRLSVSEGAVTMATMTAPESPAPSPRVGQVPHALSPRQWAQAMLRPGRAVVCDVESTDFDGAILEIAVTAQPRHGKNPVNRVVQSRCTTQLTLLRRETTRCMTCGTQGETTTPVPSSPA
ncbi:hypothetical protein CBI38_28935 [Rhodococcus oxybenzonivorans]|uniref:Uncharacterized protein n=1 Tax=Rhodococcus oxybenzonivorans TaxID=1990687 RepID=A0A2S2C266_9NOCA|nr:hypothetical protein CBI38_28935 [Rhodococcus oxybenzonivorans]